MRAIRFESPGVIALTDRAERAPGPCEVAIAIDRVGICATDLHILHGAFPTARYPLTPGHEATGVIVAVGDGVAEVAVGDRVCLDPGLPCGRCRLCRRGRPNLCTRRRAFGITDDGAAAEVLVVPEANCHVVSAEVAAGAAVLGEPLACVVHAFDLAPAPAGARVLVYGAGTVGLLATTVARHLGAVEVAVIDLDEGRLDRARAVGAGVAASSAQAVGADRADLVIDATGSAGAIADGLARVERGGCFVQIGVAHPGARIELAPYELFAREMTIVGSMTTRHSFPRAVAMLEAGVVDADVFTEDPWALNRYTDAVSAAEAGGIPKVTVRP